MSATQVREIKVVIKTDGDSDLKAVAAGFSKVNKSVAETNNILGGFKNAFKSIQGLALGFAGFGLVKEFVSTADAMQKLTDRMVLSEGSFEAARNVLGQLVAVANETKVSVEDISTVYNRLNLSLRSTGISSAALIELTQGLQQSFRLSGSTAAEATASTVQLSQGLASGQLRGQELRSVLEQNALAGDLLAKQLKITRGELLKFSEKNGGISAEQVIAAFSTGMDDLNDRAKKLQPTISEALTTAFNNLKLTMLDVNKEFGLTAKAVTAIEFASKNIGAVTASLGLLVLGYKAYTTWAVLATKATATFYAVLAAPLVGALVAAGVAIAGFVATVGVIPIAIFTAVTAFVSLFSFSEKFREFLEIAKTYAVTFLDMSEGAKSLPEAHRRAMQAVDGLTNSQQNFVLQTPEVVEQFYNIEKSSVVAFSGVIKTKSALEEFADSLKAKSGLNLTYEQSLAKINEQWLLDKNIKAYNAALKTIEIKKLTEDFKAGKMAQVEYDKKLQEIKFGKAISGLKESRGELALINAEFSKAVASGNVANYARAIDKVNLDKMTRDAKEGRTNLLAMNKALSEDKLQNYNRQLAEGSMSMEEFTSSTATERLKLLNQEWKSGTTDIYAYKKAVIETSNEFLPGSALFVGTSNYITQAGTLSSNIANAVTNTFGNLEKTFLDFTKNGKFAFKEFALSVLEDLNRIIIRSLIIRPLAQGILGAIPSGAAASGPAVSSNGGSATQGNYSNYSATGSAWDRGVQKYAMGGVVNSPTPFNHSGGKGLMGEAGPEGILPLKRTSNGDLGVQSSGGGVVVNVINQTGGQVEQKETKGPNGERMIDILITQKVKEAFASGAMDKQMSQNYGIRRKGV